MGAQLPQLPVPLPYVPAAQLAQVWSLALVQLRPLPQLVIGVQLVQLVSLVPLQPPLAYWPALQVEQLAQLSALPLTRYLPLPHDVHCESAALVQVTLEVQPATALHATHAPFDK